MERLTSFRLPAATRVGPVELQVSDLGRSVSFYERVLGLRARDVTPASAAFGADGDDHSLVRLRTQPGVVPARRGAFGLYHFAILLPDRASLGRFASHLAAFDLRIAMADHLVSEALYLSDPDGLGIEVYADRPRESWQRRGDELAMTTDPLDIESVIASGGGVPWGGAPPGTTMGHVHLHVGSLEQAEAFYHRALGFDKKVWSYPGALFMSAGGYHHHLATNIWSRGPAPSREAAQLLVWELIVPSAADLSAIGANLEAAGYAFAQAGHDIIATDPWGTRVRVRADH